jgi:hypothetical protein
VKIYKSAVDSWMYPVLAIGPLVGVSVIVWSLISGKLLGVVIGAGQLAVFAAIFFGLVLPIRYEIAGDALTVRAGLMRIVIPWDRLRSIAPSSNPLSSPALSLRRLRVDYAKASGRDAWVLISPTDRAAFLADVAEASGRHKVHGDRLIAQ